MDFALILTIACLSTGAYAAVGTTCTAEDQCDAGECCQILSEFMVASKKRAVVNGLLPKTGTCQKYTPEGGGCVTYDKMNGYCSCEPGTYCHMYEVPIASGRSARGAPMNRPGYQWISRCEKTTAGGGRRTPH
ncbi:unnamed protein product [Lymnaea stagnalis]|uniref:Prokineticin domain-containing protein n=1 Tax=Lymnaea stagnalis TaxID=6523 RepID=A0AAV2I9G0_LYMST